jgi:hypothetical protein
MGHPTLKDIWTAKGLILVQLISPKVATKIWGMSMVTTVPRTNNDAGRVALAKWGTSDTVGLQSAKNAQNKEPTGRCWGLAALSCALELHLWCI